MRNGDVALDIAPERGGGVLCFHVAGAPVFADVRGPAAADLACIPLLPFANRIAGARFAVDGRQIALEPAHDEPHALHGTGWLRAWAVAANGTDWADLRLDSPAGDGGWPWAWQGRQRFQLTDGGYRHGISLTNRGDTPMPAGIGLHPWLPCQPATLYLGLHSAEWQPGPDLLPRDFTVAATPIDWWDGAPVASRRIDCCQVGRDGALRIDWPERGLRLEMVPDAVFGFTQVYVPDADFFCVEPVSHLPDAVNRAGDTGLRWLAPGETLAGTVEFRVAGLKPRSIGAS
jgi:aldose 1-epimerase